MKWYSWLRPHFEHLITGYKIGRGPHALLIHTLPGMGDAELIHAIVSFLMCQNPKGYKICGGCYGCQLIQSGTHPDYYILHLEEGKTALGIDVIRELIEKVHRCSWLGANKVVWITNATLLTEEAENALLKTLEEPPEKTWFFLSCFEPERLLSTLRSRCRLYYLSAPRESWTLMWLQRKITVSKEKALTALRLCGGAPAAALKLLEPSVCARRSYFYSSIKEAIESCDWLSLLAILNSDYILENLYWLISLFLDAIKIQYKITLITNVDGQIIVNELSRIFPSTFLWIVLKNLCKCREQLTTIAGINRELVLINQLLYIEYCLKSGIKSSISFTCEREESCF